MSVLLNLVIARAKEPSTMASLGVLLGAVGLQVPDAVMQSAMTIVGGVAALLGVLMKEKGESS
jgi:hypothetical protein